MGRRGDGAWWRRQIRIVPVDGRQIGIGRVFPGRLRRQVVIRLGLRRSGVDGRGLDTGGFWRDAIWRRCRRGGLRRDSWVGPGRRSDSHPIQVQMPLTHLVR